MPLTMPILAIVITFYTPTLFEFKSHYNCHFILHNTLKQFFISSFIMFGIIFPVISLLILKLTKQVDSLELENQKQRSLPILLTGLFGLMLIVLLFQFNTQLPLSKHILGLAISATLMSFSYLLVNTKFKVSLHAGGAGLLLGFLLSYYTDQVIINAWPIYGACILTGIIIAARIILKKHSTKELVIGFLIGFLITFIVDYICIHTQIINKI